MQIETEEQIDTAALPPQVLDGPEVAALEPAPEPDVIKQILALFAQLASEVRALSPLNDGYISLSASCNGYSEVATGARVFYGEGWVFEFQSLADLRAQIAARDPKTVKAETIAALEARLAELKGGAQ